MIFSLKIIFKELVPDIILMALLLGINFGAILIRQFLSRDMFSVQILQENKGEAADLPIFFRVWHYYLIFQFSSALILLILNGFFI
jgi:hypothetical protein